MKHFSPRFLSHVSKEKNYLSSRCLRWREDSHSRVSHKIAQQTQRIDKKKQLKFSLYGAVKVADNKSNSGSQSIQFLCKTIVRISSEGAAISRSSYLETSYSYEQPTQNPKSITTNVPVKKLTTLPTSAHPKITDLAENQFQNTYLVNLQTS